MQEAVQGCLYEFVNNGLARELLLAEIRRTQRNHADDQIVLLRR